MDKFDLKLFKRFVALSKPYWLSEEKWTAWGLASLLALLLIAETWSNVFFNEQSGEFTSALAAMDQDRFWASIRKFCGFVVVAVPIYSYYYYLRDKLSIHWRRWQTSMPDASSTIRRYKRGRRASAPITHCLRRGHEIEMDQ